MFNKFEDSNTLIRDLGIIRTSPPRKKLCEIGISPKNNNLGTSFTNKELSILNSSNNRNNLPKMMEFHKFSNLDIPKEKIFGNSRPEHFFGQQLNIRRQSTQHTQSEKSSYNVVDRLIQYGKNKEERLKALIDGKETKMKKGIVSNKYPKTKLGGSYVMTTEDRDTSSENDGKQSPSVNILQTISQNLPDDFKRSTAIPYDKLGKRNSLSTFEEAKQTINQQNEARIGSLHQRSKHDLFYELYKEGYGVILETNEGSGRRTEKAVVSGAGENESNINYIKEEGLKTKTSGSDPSEIKNQSKLSLHSSTKYSHVESRYLNGTRDVSKSPQGSIFFIKS